MKHSIDTSWDFKNENTKTLTHCYHSYPAMMIPQIARKLIKSYGDGSKLLFDPYCGTGTSLVEANIQGIDAIGTDLNPLARLIAETKTAKINIQVLDMYLNEFNNFCFSLNFGLKNPSIVAPKFDNIDFWFGENVQKELSVVKHFIEEIQETDIRDFFYVAFSETVRECSFTRNGEFKLYRMPEKKRSTYDPDVFSVILKKLARNRKGLLQYLESLTNRFVKSKVYDFNTVEDIGEIEKESVDLVVTSPPYGDSRTTVAYGQFSRLASQWLGFDNPNQIDKKLMGGNVGTNSDKLEKFGVEEADNVIDMVAQKDPKRGKEVYCFYNEYLKSICNVALLLKKKAYCCYVVGNRKVKDIILPTDKITKAFFAINGLNHEKTITRNIPSKKMPSKNSPTNECGVVNDTMCKEFILIMRKN